MSENRGKDREKNLKKEDYLTDGYFSYKQWESFRFQVKSIYKLIHEGKILEIGCGNGFVGAILRQIGFLYENLDINKNLNPTYLGDIADESLIFNKKYNLVICAEVLEHIPFEKFRLCLNRIAEISNNYAIITLPNCQDEGIASMHFWELNSDANTEYNNIRKTINEYFEIAEEGNIPNCEYHHYYILKKRNAK